MYLKRCQNRNFIYLHPFMLSPKKIGLQKEPSFIIRKPNRPLTVRKTTSFKLSPDKKNRQSRRNINEASLALQQTCSPSTLGLSTTCWCLYDMNVGRELGFRQNYQRQIASLTKIMTTIVSIDFIEQYHINKDLLVRITDAASKMTGTTANLKSGKWIRLNNLLYGAMLPSGNDAAYALAQTIGYFMLVVQRSEYIWTLPTIQNIDLTKQMTNIYVNQFIRHMNLKSDILQLAHTRFSNPHGLQNAFNTSSAKDVLKLSIYATKNKQFRQIMNSKCKRYQMYENQYKWNKVVEEWQNTNMLLEKGWEGIKTGFTIPAGGCLASLREGIYIVILNSFDGERRFVQTQKLYNWYIERGDRQYSPEKILQNSCYFSK